MEIITRSDAVAAGLNKYFTGQHCKNGHVDFRYTKSGACQSCIAENNGRAPSTDVGLSDAAKALAEAQVAYRKERYAAIERSREAAKLQQAERLAAVRAERERKASELSAVDIEKAARKEAKALLVQVRLRCYEVDRDALAAAVWSFAVMRSPVITLGDVDPRLLPQDKTAGTGLYAFYCHSEDVPQVRQLADGMLRGHSINADAGRTKAIEAAQQYVDPDTTPPMSFK